MSNLYSATRCAFDDITAHIVSLNKRLPMDDGLFIGYTAGSSYSLQLTLPFMGPQVNIVFCCL